VPPADIEIRIGRLARMELKRRSDTQAFVFGDIAVRELTPEAFAVASFAEVVLPIGVERPERENTKDHRIYIGIAGDLEFKVGESTFHLRPGDVVHIDKGETYGFHNGGYEEARMLLLRVPGPSTSAATQP
jgi:glyoxylate utilization-related uncharacterized protein